MSTPKKALALLSGGLDSLLAAKVILDQGIIVEGINFFTGFCHSGHTSAIRNQKKNKVKRNDALWSAEQLGIKLHIVDIVDDYKDILINPQYGYGKNLNPCLDCKIFMLKQAYKWMKEHDFDFIITGEVIGQRPKSQRKETMPIVANKSGVNDLLVRPLCAKNLEITKPEREGWIDRDKLYAFHGRDRKPQISLANSYNFEDYAQPAGGCCVLTDPSYTNRLADFWEHRQDKNYELDDIILLKVGRHLRLADNFKMIIARDEGESNFLQGYRKQFTHMYVKDHTGPTVLLDGFDIEQDLELAARVMARFSSGRNEEKVEVMVNHLSGAQESLSVKPMLSDEINQEWYI